MDPVPSAALVHADLLLWAWAQWRAYTRRRRARWRHRAISDGFRRRRALALAWRGWTQVTRARRERRAVSCDVGCVHVRRCACLRVGVSLFVSVENEIFR
jgi:hypothetical protein